MNPTKKRKILSFDFAGTLVFYIFCLMFGSSFFVFLGSLSQNIHRLIISDSPYYLLFMGSVFALLGVLFYVLRRFFYNYIDGRSFIYMPFLCLILMYVFYVVSIAKPSWILVSALLLIGVWAYSVINFGLISVLLCFAGFGLAGIYASIYELSVVNVLCVFKFTFIVYSIASLLRLITTKKIYVLVPVVVSMLFALYPVGGMFDNYGNSKLDGYDHISSHVLNSRQLEVQISRSGTPEHILLLENGRRTQSFPFSYEQELSLCFALLENKDPGNILIAGDAPLGFFSVLQKIPRIGVVHYFPSDPSYVKVWNNFISNDILNTFVVIPEKKYLMDHYGIVVFFPPTVRGYGTKAGLSRSMFRLLSSRLSPTGTFTIALSNDLIKTELPSNLEDRLKNILYKIYGSVSEVQVNGFKFLFASKDPKNISSDPSVLKYRYLELGVEYDYTKAKQFFDSTGLNIKNVAPTKLPSHNGMVILILSVFSVLLAVMYFVRNTNLDTIAYYSILGAGFGLSMLINQMFTVNSYSVFTPCLGVFLSASVLSMITFGWKRIDAANKYWSRCLFGCLALILLLSMVFTKSGSLYPMLLGSLAGLIFMLTTSTILRVISLFLIGVGIGISGLFTLTESSMSISEISFLLASMFILLLIYNVILLRRAK